jgi:hypothetical protein
MAAVSGASGDRGFSHFTGLRVEGKKTNGMALLGSTCGNKSAVARLEHQTVLVALNLFGIDAWDLSQIAPLFKVSVPLPVRHD